MTIRPYFLTALVMLTIAVGCVKEGAIAPDAAGEDPVTEAKAFLDWYNGQRAAMDKTAALAYWTAANSGNKADFEAYAAADLALRTFHSDGERYRQVGRLIKAGELLDPITRRALDVARLAYEENQLPQAILQKLVAKSSQIEQIFNTYRATMDGRSWTNNALLETLAKETDSDRRKAAWDALKQVGAQVGPLLVELAHLRNDAARTLGYANFWDMRVRMQEHDPAMLLELFDRLEKSTNEPFRAMKASLDGELSRRLDVPVNAMMPWHYDNPFFQAAPPSEAVDLDVFYQDHQREDIVEIARTFYSDIGLPLDSIIDRSDYFDREGKDQHAFCIDIDRQGDVRMLLNIQATADWMDTMLHEAGHAVYAAYNDMSLPYNLRDAAHILTTEAVAMLFGALGKNPTWMVAYAGVDSAKVAPVKAAIYEQRRREQLIFARWAMVMFHFEKALYENPDQDLNTVWYDHVERLQLLKRPVDRDLPDWAAKPHFTIAPVYYHNYLLGELFAAQLRSTLAGMAAHDGPAATLSFNGRKDFGTFMKDRVFRPGMRMEWPDFVKAATGRPFGPESFVDEVR
jgi:peptidyl-dipeptidase A